jgi:hypothetical protein
MSTAHFEASPPAYPAPAARAHTIPAAHRAVLQRIFADMETLTPDGRRDSMIKILSFLGGAAGRARERLDIHAQWLVATLVARLLRESSRPTPDVSAFIDAGEQLLQLLD